MDWFQLGEWGFRLRMGGRNHFLWLGLLLVCAAPWAVAQSGPRRDPPGLPDAPVPQRAQAAARGGLQPGRSQEGAPWVVKPCTRGACNARGSRAELCCGRGRGEFKAYLKSRAYRIYTPRQLAVLAARNVADPFNLLSVLGSAAIVVGSDSHSIYGPGMPGLGRATGVTLTENMTDEFFGTFLIPSLDHQAPGFRRMPNRGFWQRLAHCGTQVFWTRSQTGVPMVNYSSVVGTMAEQGVAVTYVPFRSTGWSAAAERVGLNYATAPIGNLINEFLPQVASHLNVRVVFFQNIINRVATQVGQPPGA